MLKKEILGVNDQSETKGMSTTNGRISEISSNLSKLEDTFIVDILKSKINNKESFTYNILYGDKKDLKKFIHILKKENISVEDIKKHIKFMYSDISTVVGGKIWIRDNSINLKDANGNIIIMEPLTSRDEERKDQFNSENADNDILAAKSGIDIVQSGLIFQGGNIRQTDEYAFIGSDDILVNAMDTKLLDHNLSKINTFNFNDVKINEVINKFENLFGKKVIPIGMNQINGKWEHNGQQETGISFHIDLFITPLGGNEIAVRKDTSQKIIDELVRNGFQIHFIGGTYYNNVLIENYIDKAGKTNKKVYLPQYFDESLEKSILNYKNDINEINNKLNNEDLEKEEKENIQTILKMNINQLKIHENAFNKLVGENINAVQDWKQIGFEVIPVRVDRKNLELMGSLNCRTNEMRE